GSETKLCQPLLVPVEDHPDPIVLGGITEDEGAFGSVLLALLGALGREDLEEVVEVFDLRHCESISVTYWGDPALSPGSGVVGVESGWLGNAAAGYAQNSSHA